MFGLLAALILTAPPFHPGEAEAVGPFAQRGYYITFMRMPTYDLADWKRIIAFGLARADQGNGRPRHAELREAKAISDRPRLSPSD